MRDIVATRIADVLRSRVAITAADQAASAGTNFALNVFLLIVLPPAEYAAYAVGYTIYLIVLNISRAVAGESSILLASNVGCRQTLPAVRGRLPPIAQHSTGLSLLIGTVAGLTSIPLSWMVNDPLRTTVMAFGAFMPLLLVQDSLRYAYFATGAPSGALLNDLVWAVLQLTGMLALWVGGARGAELYVLAWGLSGAVSALVVLRVGRLLPAQGASVDWAWQHRGIMGSLLTDSVLSRIAANLSVLLVGAVAGVHVVGALRAARGLYGPLQSAHQLALIYAVPEGLRRLEQGRHEARRFLARFSTSLCAASLLYTTVMWIGAQLVPGLSYEGLDGVLLFVGVGAAFSGLASYGRVGFRVFGHVRTLARLRWLTAPLLMTLMLAGAAAWGAAGAAGGAALEACVEAAVFWVFIERTTGGARRYRCSDKVSFGRHMERGVTV